MGLSNKEQLIEHLRKADDLIKGFKDDQLILVKNYVKQSYGITEGTVVMFNDIKAKVHHFSFTEGGRKINIHYQLVKTNGSVQSTIFSKDLFNLKIEIISNE